MGESLPYHLRAFLILASRKVAGRVCENYRPVPPNGSPLCVAICIIEDTVSAENKKNLSVKKIIQRYIQNLADRVKLYIGDCSLKSFDPGY